MSVRTEWQVPTSNKRLSNMAVMGTRALDEFRHHHLLICQEEDSHRNTQTDVTKPTNAHKEETILRVIHSSAE